MRARRGMLALAGAGLLWGTLGIVVRLEQDAGLSTTTIAFWRLVMAVALLAVLVGPAGLRSLLAQRRSPGRLLLVGAGFLVFQWSYFVGVQQAGVAVATLVTLGTAPVAITAWESSRGGSAPPPRTLVILGFALAGLALVTSTSGADAVTAPRPLLGVAFSVLSGLAYASSAEISRPLSATVGPVAITAATSLVALVLLTPFALAAGVAIPLRLGVVAGLVHLGVVATAAAYVLFYAGLRTTPSSVAMVITLLEPAAAAVLAVLLLSEPLTWQGATGALLLLGAVAVLYLGTPPA